jgi:hypothetical protein
LEHFHDNIEPRMVILEEDGDALGYSFFRVYGTTAHVVHVVVDPRARGRGAGRALLDAVRARVVAEGCARWFLNVKQDNAPAIRLYERCGFAIEQEGWAVRTTWAALATLPEDVRQPAPFTPTAADDAELATRLGVDLDRVALIRAKPGATVLLALREDRVPVAFGAFDPTFPGIYPLRVARLGVARALFDAMRPHAIHEHVQLFIEGDCPLFEAVHAAGASLLHATFRMAASL